MPRSVTINGGFDVRKWAHVVWRIGYLLCHYATRKILSGAAFRGMNPTATSISSRCDGRFSAQLHRIRPTATDVSSRCDGGERITQSHNMQDGILHRSAIAERHSSPRSGGITHSRGFQPTDLEQPCVYVPRSVTINGGFDVRKWAHVVWRIGHLLCHYATRKILSGAAFRGMNPTATSISSRCDGGERITQSHSMQDAVYLRNTIAERYSSPQRDGGTIFITANRWQHDSLHRVAVE